MDNPCAKALFVVVVQLQHSDIPEHEQKRGGYQPDAV